MKKDNPMEWVGRINEIRMRAERIVVEEKLFKDTDISIKDVTCILGTELPTDDTIVTYYYSQVDSKEYFLADILVDQHWYTNYK